MDSPNYTLEASPEAADALRVYADRVAHAIDHGSRPEGDRDAHVLAARATAAMMDAHFAATNEGLRIAEEEAASARRHGLIQAGDDGHRAAAEKKSADERQAKIEEAKSKLAANAPKA